MANKNKQKKENEKLAFDGVSFPLLQNKVPNTHGQFAPPPPSVISQVTLMGSMTRRSMQIFIRKLNPLAFIITSFFRCVCHLIHFPISWETQQPYITMLSVLTPVKLVSCVEPGLLY
jgi:hypothetical protein